MISCTQKHFHHQATKHLVKLLFNILGKAEEREREREGIKPRLLWHLYMIRSLPDELLL